MLVEAAQDFGLLFQLDERKELGPDQRRVEALPLAEDHSGEVEPVLVAIGKGLENDEILRAAGNETTPDAK